LKNRKKFLKVVYMYLQNLKQHANLNRGAMETGDHSNGASPKSQMNRKNNLMSVKGMDVKQM
jgi:hypothetical protein